MYIKNETAFIAIHIDIKIDLPPCLVPYTHIEKSVRNGMQSLLAHNNLEYSNMFTI